MLSMLYTIVALLVSPPFTSAQVPVPVHSMAYATVEGKALYIQGGRQGRVGGSPNSQFYALDLTQPSWDASNPPWRLLITGAGQQSAPRAIAHCMTVTKDSQSLIIWDAPENAESIRSGHAISKYDIPTSAWLRRQDLNNTASTFWMRYGFAKAAATDPATGLIYIPGAYMEEAAMAVYNNTPEINFTAGNITSAPDPIPLVSGGLLSEYTAIWSVYHNSLLLYGGVYTIKNNSSAPGVFLDRMMEYNPIRGSWSIMETKGTSPGNLTNHCMVSAYGGSKMVLFGGSTSNTIATITPQGNIYILDVPSMTWSQGTQARPSEHRANMACTNDQATLGTTIIYDLRTNQWTTRVSLDGDGSSTGTKATTPLGGIIGGSVGAVTVVCAVIGFVLYRRRKRRNNIQGPIGEHQPQHQNHSKHGDNLGSPKRDPHEVIKEQAVPGPPRNPAFVSAEIEQQFAQVHRPNNPEYAPLDHYQGFKRSDPQYSETPLQEPRRNPQCYAIPEYFNGDVALRQQWALWQEQQQQQAALLKHQQQQYLADFDRSMSSCKRAR
ncbi:hypothetical protein BGX23_008013 [Mortierella sp. AD031]|nr:hypothetical protein BGX23_008013 [Mortierella sp. AD031]